MAFKQIDPNGFITPHPRQGSIGAKPSPEHLIEVLQQVVRALESNQPLR